MSSIPPPLLAQLADAAAEAHGLSPSLFRSLVHQESGFNPRSLSPRGAYGLTQLMPETAAELLGTNPGRALSLLRDNPLLQLDLGARYLSTQLSSFGSLPLALAAYNAGPDNVRRYGGVPPFPETQHYVRSVLAGQDGLPDDLKPIAVGEQGALERVLSVRVPRASPSLENLLQPSTDSQVRGVAESMPDLRAGVGRQPSQDKLAFPLAASTSIGARHETEGLANFPARDFFAPAGTAVLAPEQGTIVKLSGHDPALGVVGKGGIFGLSAYLQTLSGRTYFLTHLGGLNVKLGDKLLAGDRIGSVGNFPSGSGIPDHVHIGVRGGDVDSLSTATESAPSPTAREQPKQSVLERVLSARTLGNSTPR